MRRSVAAMILVVALLRHLNTDQRQHVDASPRDDEHSTVDPVQEHIRHIMNYRLQSAPKAPTLADIITIIDENSGLEKTAPRKMEAVGKTLNYIELFRVLARWQLSNVKNCYELDEEGSGRCSDVPNDERN